MNRAVACFHHFVVESSDHRLLRRVFDTLHRAGLALVRLAAFLDPAIEGLLVRDNLESGSQPVPGLSDYDLTVICRSTNRSLQPAFLRRLWIRYRMLKCALPMLGEVDVFTLDSFRDYLQFGPGPTVVTKKHVPQFVKTAGLKSELADLLTGEGTQVLMEDVLNQIVLRYIMFVVPRQYRYLQEPTRFNELSLRHAMQNIANALQHLGGSAAGVAEQGAAAGFCEILKVLTNVSTAYGVKPVVSKPILPTEEQTESLDRLMASLQVVFDRLWQCEACVCTGVVWRSFLTHDKYVFAVVLDDNCSSEGMMKTAQMLAQGFQSAPDVFGRWCRNDPLQNYFPVIPHPVLVTRSLWRVWMSLDPLAAASAKVSGAVLCGDNQVLDDAVPRAERVARFVSIRYAATLSLQNNMRTIPAERLPLLYLVMNDHVQAYLEALKGPIRTIPQVSLTNQEHEASSAESYENVSRSLQELHAALSAPG